MTLHAHANHMFALLSRSSVLLTLTLLVACGDSGTFSSQGQHSHATWQSDAVAEGNLRIATFNIRNYPFLPISPDEPAPAAPLSYQLLTDDIALLEILGKLDFDLLGVQEIVDTEAFSTIVEELSRRTGRNYQAEFAANDAGNPQHVGLIVDQNKLQIQWTREHPEIDVSGRLRPGLSAYLQSTAEDGVDFGVMILHLASGSSVKRAALRAEQSAIAGAIAAKEKAETMDADYIVLGDLNTAREEKEFELMDSAFFDEAGLTRQANALSCTSYWVKKSSNPLLRSSWLDQVYLSSLEERDSSVPLVAGAHCAENRCEHYESTDPQSGSSFFAVSDHCPVYFEIADTDQDAAPSGA